jgi:hypothetical protein
MRLQLQSDELSDFAWFWFLFERKFPTIRSDGEIESSPGEQLRNILNVLQVETIWAPIRLIGAVRALAGPHAREGASLLGLSSIPDLDVRFVKGSVVWVPRHTLPVLRSLQNPPGIVYTPNSTNPKKFIVNNLLPQLFSEVSHPEDSQDYFLLEKGPFRSEPPFRGFLDSRNPVPKFPETSELDSRNPVPKFPETDLEGPAWDLWFKPIEVGAEDLPLETAYWVSSGEWDPRYLQYRRDQITRLGYAQQVAMLSL